MKKALLTIFFLNLIICVFAQHKKADSLKRAIDTARSSDEKILLIAKLAHNYSAFKPDTSLLLAQQGLQMAKKNGFLEGEGRCYKESGEALEEMGNYPNALNAYLNHLKIAQQLNRQYDIGQALTNIGFLYEDQGEFRPALDYTLKAKNVIDAIKNKKGIHDFEFTQDVVLLNIGYYYYQLNILDSALIYEQNAYELAIKIHNDDNMGNILQNLGLIQEKYGNATLAITYYRMSVQKSETADKAVTLTDTYLRMAEFFRRSDQTDSCIYYSSKALVSARAAIYTKGILEASTILSDIYSASNTVLAYQYLKTATIAKDSLYSQEKVRQVQNLKFAEQAREQEIAELKLQQDEDRKNNLQLSAIALFIPIFFLLSLLLSKIKIHTRVIEFMSVLSILFLFEFATLFIHPLVGKITNDTPIVEFLIFVLLAAVMVPAHHHLTHWLKERLAHSRKWIKHDVEPVKKEEIIVKPIKKPIKPGIIKE